MNRFNNFFEGSAALYHHRKEIINIFANYKVSLNLKLDSVKCDIESSKVQGLLHALGIIFFKVTGPFWAMLNSDVQYVDQYAFIQEMLGHFQDWSDDSTGLLSADGPAIFSVNVPALDSENKNMRKKYDAVAKFTTDHLQKNVVYQSLFEEDLPGEAVTKVALQKIMKSFIICTERQLSDFLPDGKYGNEPTPEMRDLLKHCKVTNLVAENAFGDLDFSQYRRRHASLHFHSGVQMVKQNKTISLWLTSKSPKRPRLSGRGCQGKKW